MAQFLAVMRRVTERFSDDDFAPIMEPEADMARRLYTEGVIRDIYSRKDIPGALLMVEAATLEEAQVQILRLPLAAKGMLEVQIIPLGPYRGFAPRT
jgi:hypothetical protein